MSLDALLEFPCEFPIKVFGPAEGDFAASVEAAVRLAAPELEELGVAVRASGGGRFVAVTVTFIASSQAQIEAIYQRIGTLPGVLMVL
ncbi:MULTISPECIES: YbeD family protein [Methylococcus]|jgi:putative lipoic acid-binding regulatory protein|uniref:UPF0250 protein MCA0107 n=2 Tax=Methylococcus capsulatus TaxID=414 RepID=Q60CJ9_METCA|nr:DUF493 domain-containing protein [Methylococcus capsulatus]AAU90706.1 conserved hypothetical protein [Methylococcus capsulatus str. Bath]QXP86394.1 DUF493 domain-containing protein [Methylococcus capsulatus]QXP89389.1 DUF493 domain-containing protein [Methylococcus capsulatus]QXP93937.1 DUF493 domain-containing protein [Methylococcus capsulatus]UQN11338.1 DUF493 domain-containing protein [Methylococcus capsulatus]